MLPKIYMIKKCKVLPFSFLPQYFLLRCDVTNRISRPNWTKSWGGSGHKFSLAAGARCNFSLSIHPSLSLSPFLLSSHLHSLWIYLTMSLLYLYHIFPITKVSWLYVFKNIGFLCTFRNNFEEYITYAGNQLCQVRIAGY